MELTILGLQKGLCTFKSELSGGGGGEEGEEDFFLYDQLNCHNYHMQYWHLCTLWLKKML